MNRTIHRFFIPDGVWYDFITGKKFPGNKKYVSFFKDEEYPVFAHAGSIIPLSNRSDYNNTGLPLDLEIQIFPGVGNTYTLYEDDGVTNLYKEGSIDRQTRLFRNTSLIPRFSFIGLDYQGCLKGGNYTFYIKYSDEDYNKTDIVCESGQVSIFKGTLNNIKSISGTLQDEHTDKSVKLLISNIDLTFSKIYIYYTREYSDTNGFRLSETVCITKPYKITDSEIKITINGFEETELVTPEELQIRYNYVSNVKTQAQVQDMLFFGNINNVNVDIKNLQNISYFFKVTLKQKEKSIG